MREVSTLPQNLKNVQAYALHFDIFFSKYKGSSNSTQYTDIILDEIANIFNVPFQGGKAYFRSLDYTSHEVLD